MLEDIEKEFALLDEYMKYYIDKFSQLCDKYLDYHVAEIIKDPESNKPTSFKRWRELYGDRNELISFKDWKRLNKIEKTIQDMDSLSKLKIVRL